MLFLKLERGEKMNKDWRLENALLSVLSGSREALHAPDVEVEPGEEILGVLENPIARAMYSLMIDLNKANSSAGNKLNNIIHTEGGLTKEIMAQIEPEIHRAKNQCLVTAKLFWEIVHEEFPKSRIATVSVSVRKGWKIVIYKNNTPSFFDQLQMQISLMHSGLFDQEE